MLCHAPPRLAANAGKSKPLRELQRQAIVAIDMATDGDNDMKPHSPLSESGIRTDRTGTGQLANKRRSGLLSGNGARTEIADEWHRILTGRQSPEPVSVKLRSIYGKIVAEQLPNDMLDLLSQLDSQSIET